MEVTEQKITNPEDLFEQKKESRWINKQRTLIVATRGITDRHRHIMLDLVNMMSHSKKECKIEKKDIADQINELCYIHSCCNFLFFEARKKSDLYLHAGRFPNGPTVKFQVENLHTTQELKMTGNCLKGSRPILSFDANFSQVPHLKLCREILTHIFNVPKFHPKSKPCVDHCFSFIYTDDRIWFRNYQIFQETQNKLFDVQELHEIGPRFVLHPINILEGCLLGTLIYRNPKYTTPVQESALNKRQKLESILKKEQKKIKAEQVKHLEVEQDIIDDEDLYNEEAEEKLKANPANKAAPSKKKAKQQQKQSQRAKGQNKAQNEEDKAQNEEGDEKEEDYEDVDDEEEGQADTD